MKPFAVLSPPPKKESVEYGLICLLYWCLMIAIFGWGTALYKVEGGMLHLCLKPVKANESSSGFELFRNSVF